MYNPMDPEFIQNPYPFYAELRKNSPVYFSELGFWVVTGFKDSKYILQSKKFGKRYGDILISKFGAGIFEEPIIKLANNMMLLQNPPEHRSMREVIVKGFSTSRIKVLGLSIKNIVNDLIDNMITQNQVDLIECFAHRLPLRVICELIGIEKNEFNEFKHNVPLLSTLGRMFDPASLTREDMDMLNDNAKLLYSYFNNLCHTKKSSDTLISLLLESESKSKINRETIVANLVLLFLAGYETTAKFIGNAIYVLFNNKDQLDKLRVDKKLFPLAVRELMRYESPIQISGRIAFEDVKISNTLIQEGDFVMPIIGSANRDPTIFFNPDKLDITRNESNSLSMGGGIHQCPGEILTYLEAEIALDALLDRIPNLQIKDINKPSWQKKSALRGLDYLIGYW